MTLAALARRLWGAEREDRTMERKTCSLSVKMTGGEISGYGAIFGTVDQGGDRIAPGAFKGIGGRKVRMLRDHDPSKVIGVWTRVEQDEKGLAVTGQLADTPLGQETRTLLEAGALEGLSIGYITRKAGREGNVRVLEEVDVREVSIVTFPMNEAARIDAIKALEDGRPDALAALYRMAGIEAGLDQDKAEAAAAAAVKALAPRPEGIDEVVAALRARRIASKGA